MLAPRASPSKSSSGRVSPIRRSTPTTSRLHPRDLDDPQFEWAFQRQLFDCLHDYLVEMFIRTPQHRKEHQQMEREGKL